MDFLGWPLAKYRAQGGGGGGGGGGDGGGRKEGYELLRMISIVHAWGRDDHVRSGCVEMHEMCDGDVCFQMDFEGGHHMPLKDVEAKDLCDLIRAAWFASGGVYEVGKGEKY